jgi:hypothetical protein
MQRQKEPQHEPEEQENTLSLDAMQRAALQPGRNRNSQISSLEAWEATASVEQAERDANKERYRIGRQEPAPAPRQLTPEEQREAQIQAIAAEFRAAREQGEQDREQGQDMDLDF